MFAILYRVAVTVDLEFGQSAVHLICLKCMDGFMSLHRSSMLSGVNPDPTTLKERPLCAVLFIHWLPCRTVRAPRGRVSDADGMVVRGQQLKDLRPTTAAAADCPVYVSAHSSG